jgi:hypothetical protein
MLGAVGISGVPPDPAKEFEELDAGDLNAAWLSGAILVLGECRSLPTSDVDAVGQQKMSRITNPCPRIRADSAIRTTGLRLLLCKKSALGALDTVPLGNGYGSIAEQDSTRPMRERDSTLSRCAPNGVCHPNRDYVRLLSPLRLDY